MTTYALLMNWTNKGIEKYMDSEKGEEPGDVKDRLREGVTELVQGAKGEVLQWLWTFGEYDIISLIQMPSDEGMAAVSLTLNYEGIQTKTLRAFEAEPVLTILRIRAGGGRPLRIRAGGG
jgi:uncharacterized protein with GYD domain